MGDEGKEQEALWSSVRHYYLAQITVLCDDSVERRGWIDHMPFKGNEHEPCALRDERGELYAVYMREVVRAVGRDPRRF
jgi:hypothetical protein